MKLSFGRVVFGALAILPASLAFWFVTDIVDQVRLNANHVTTLGTIGGPAWDGHGKHYYAFAVDGVTYHGSSQIDGPNHSLGQMATVYYVPTNPSVSSMRTPRDPDAGQGIIVGIFVVVFLFLTVRATSFALGFRKLPDVFRSWEEWDVREGEPDARPNASEPPPPSRSPPQA